MTTITYHKALRRLMTLAAAAIGLLTSNAQDVIFDSMDTDTTRVNTMLVDVLAAHHPNPGDATVDLALRFVGTPYVGGTLEGDTEVLRVNLNALDCTTFVEDMMAMTMTVAENRSSWLDFLFNLQRIRYRGGVIDGYPSRLHYIADWAVDNQFRGNFADVTNRFPRYSYEAKNIDFMSRNADKYPALADSANLARIRNVEIGYRHHRFPYIKTRDLAAADVKAAFHNGDIVAFTTNIPGLDVSHMGIVVVRDGEPYVIHASLSAGKVVVTDVPIDKFLKRNRQMTGVRVFRIPGS